MDRNNIIILPHANLRKTSKRIQSIGDDVLSIIKNMQSATLDWEKHRDHELGVALAAVQINELVRAIIIRQDPENKEDTTFTTLLNPQIIRKSKETTLDYEGCLSIPNIYGMVPRSDSIKIKALDENGHETRISAKGFMARVLQHEIDHLHGKLFIDHIKNDPKAFFSLNKTGDLVPLDYDKDVTTNNILW